MSNQINTPISNKNEQHIEIPNEPISDDEDEQQYVDAEAEADDFLQFVGNSPQKEYKSSKSFGFTKPKETLRKNKFSKSKPVNRGTYKNFDKMPDIRKHDTIPDPELYDQLINIILNAKKDIKFSPSAETREGAARYGKSRGLLI